MWQEFKPTVFFLLKFFVLYLGLSTAYGLYIGAYESDAKVDPATRVVARHCSGSAGLLGYQTQIVEDDHLRRESLPEQTYDSLWFDDIYAVSVEEGCNGLNVMILFVSFVIAFGGSWRAMLWFIPAGLLFIHLANLGRLLFLSLMNVEWGGRGFHFFHKYGFTAVLYLAILVLWYLWVMYLNAKKAPKAKQDEE